MTDQKPTNPKVPRRTPQDRADDKVRGKSISKTINRLSAVMAKVVVDNWQRVRDIGDQEWEEALQQEEDNAIQP
jgi:hypothetical protein